MASSDSVWRLGDAGDATDDDDDRGGDERGREQTWCRGRTPASMRSPGRGRRCRFHTSTARPTSEKASWFGGEVADQIDLELLVDGAAHIDL